MAHVQRPVPQARQAPAQEAPPAFINPHFAKAHEILAKVSNSAPETQPFSPNRFLKRSRVLVLCINSVNPKCVGSASDLNSLLSLKVNFVSLHALPFDKTPEYISFIKAQKINIVILFCDSPAQAREFIAQARKASPSTRFAVACHFSDANASEFAQIADCVIVPPFYVSALYAQLDGILARPPKTATR
ncbi:hypothetical protein HY992_06495 [Candidatus Micrarchaeota archaeon]|nr:hypothetical protein [Candidatus Micrarchaeota archaeon]